jgi:hypothetical protein
MRALVAGELAERASDLSAAARSENMRKILRNRRRRIERRRVLLRLRCIHLNPLNPDACRLGGTFIEP